MKQTPHQASRVLRVIVFGLTLLQGLPPAVFAQQARSEVLSPVPPTLFDYAVREANQIQDAGHREAKLAYISSKCAEAGRFEQALLLADKLTDAWARSETLTKIAIALWRAGQTDKAGRLIARLREMRLPPRDTSAEELKDKIHESLLTFYLETAQCARAIETAKMHRQDFSKVADIENVLAVYLTREKSGPPAWLMDELLRLSASLRYNSETDAIAEAQTPAQKQLAEQRLARAKRATMRSINFYVALSYAKSGELQRAEQMAKEVSHEKDEEGVTHAASEESVLFRLASTYATEGNDAEAFRLAHKIRGELQSMVWFELAEIFARRGNSEQAEKALAPLFNPEPNTTARMIFALTSAAVIHQLLGRTERSEQLLRTAFEQSLEEQDGVIKVQYLTFVATRAAEAGQTALMREVLVVRNKLSTEDSFFTLGIIGYRAALKKQFAAVDIILAEMENPTDKDIGFQKVLRFNLIAETLLRVGEKERAARALRQAIAFKIANPANTGSYELQRLAVLLARVERPDLLLELADSIRTPDRAHFSNTLADLGVEFSKRGWQLDERQRKTLDRLLASSKEPPSASPWFPSTSFP